MGIKQETQCRSLLHEAINKIHDALYAYQLGDFMPYSPKISESRQILDRAGDEWDADCH